MLEVALNLALASHRHRRKSVRNLDDQTESGDRDFVSGLLKDQDRVEASLHPGSWRPWGHTDLIDRGERFQVKRIVVAPGAKHVRSNGTIIALSFGSWYAAQLR